MVQCVNGLRNHYPKNLCREQSTVNPRRTLASTQNILISNQTLCVLLLALNIHLYAGGAHQDPILIKHLCCVVTGITMLQV